MESMEDLSKNAFQCLWRPVSVASLQKPRKLLRSKSDDGIGSKGGGDNRNELMFKIKTENLYCSVKEEGYQLDANKNELKETAEHSLKFSEEKFSFTAAKSENYRFVAVVPQNAGKSTVGSLSMDDYQIGGKAECDKEIYRSLAHETEQWHKNGNQDVKEVLNFQNKKLASANSILDSQRYSGSREPAFLKCELPATSGSPEVINIIGTNTQTLTETLSVLQRYLGASLIRCDSGKDQLIREVESLVGESLVSVKLAALPPKGQYSFERLLALSNHPLSKEKPHRWTQIAEKHPSVCLTEVKGFFKPSDSPGW